MHQGRLKMFKIPYWLTWGGPKTQLWGQKRPTRTLDGVSWRISKDASWRPLHAYTRSCPVPSEYKDPSGRAMCFWNHFFGSHAPPMGNVANFFPSEKIYWNSAPFAQKINSIRPIAAEIWRKFDSEVSFLPGIEIFKNVTDCRAPSLCLLRNGPFLAGNGWRR
jgi:hypothetical protein